MTTALRSETFSKLQLNAGVFLKNFEYSSIASASALLTAIQTAITSGNILGATRGGGSFNVGREMRNPEIDGMRYNFKGSFFVDSTDPYLSTNLVEVTPENFAVALGGTIAGSSGKKTLTVNTAIDSSDYLTNLCWVGDIADGRLVLIRLDNALNTADFTFTFTDKGEGTYSVEFHAHQDDVLDYDNAPFGIVYFDTAT
jgi:hypothetical protein